MIELLIFNLRNRHPVASNTRSKEKMPPGFRIEGAVGEVGLFAAQDLKDVVAHGVGGAQVVVAVRVIEQAADAITADDGKLVVQGAGVVGAASTETLRVALGRVA